MRTKFGQNFLVSQSAAQKIAVLCAGFKASHMVEVGPGKGFLTRELLPYFSGRLTLIEIDPEMAIVLRERLGSDGFRLINADFMEADLAALLPPEGDIVFGGNLPYSVGSAILQKALDFPRFCGGAMMFQKEVALRICAKPGTEHYGVLSLASQSRAECSLVFSLGPRQFNPPPKVDSAVVLFRKLPVPAYGEDSLKEHFFHAVKGSFAHRRKTIVNSLSTSLGLEKTETERCLRESGIDPAARAETVDLPSFVRLAQALRRLRP